MKIGIMTFWWAEDNYGQSLQCYALQRYLRDQGHDAYLIRFDPRGGRAHSSVLSKMMKVLNPRKVLGYARSLLAKAGKRKIAAPYRGFGDFRNHYINQSEKIYPSYESLRDDPPEADAYVVGSDQIWNFYGAPLRDVRGAMNAWFLNFGPEKTMRLSYAASFGSDTLSRKYLRAISPLLTRFDYVSVREAGGVELCARAGRSDAELVYDPTMLLPATAYRRIIAENVSSSQETAERFCFLYALSNDCEIPAMQIERYAADNALSVRYASNNRAMKEFPSLYPTIPEWLSLIANAECVVTNSFHGTVFAILFNKNFVVLPLKGSVFSKMNNRITSLLDRLDIHGKVFDGSFETTLGRTVDWVAVNRRIDEDVFFRASAFTAKLRGAGYTDKGENQ